LSPSYTRCYPLVAARGEGAVIEDVDGNRFLDFNAGIAVVATGHCHPRVVEAIRAQAEKLIHMSGTDFYYENMVDLAEKLAALVPGGVPRRVYFCNSGTEAIEAALKLARHHTGRTSCDRSLSCKGAAGRHNWPGTSGGVEWLQHADYPPAPPVRRQQLDSRSGTRRATNERARNPTISAGGGADDD